jgi:hypothetical protein
VPHDPNDRTDEFIDHAVSGALDREHAEAVERTYRASLQRAPTPWGTDYPAIGLIVGAVTWALVLYTANVKIAEVGAIAFLIAILPRARAALAWCVVVGALGWCYRAWAG